LGGSKKVKVKVEVEVGEVEAGEEVRKRLEGRKNGNWGTGESRTSPTKPRFRGFLVSPTTIPPSKIALNPC
jgi:hypothetical protein